VLARFRTAEAGPAPAQPSANVPAGNGGPPAPPPRGADRRPPVEEPGEITSF
jgi:hypothetical protein